MIQLKLTLKQQIARIEKTYPEDFYPINDCAMYRRRNIFIAADGRNFILNSLGGVDSFRNLEEASNRIDLDSNRYPVNTLVKI